MMNTPNCIPGGKKTRDPEGVARGGGFDRGVLELAQNLLLFHTSSTLQGCLSGSMLYSFSVYSLRAQC